MKNPELLAPAGSMESLNAALRCGADAVYIGGRLFSARQNAVNFDEQELKSAADLCHLYGKKLYLTVNTIIFDSQAREFSRTIENALIAGVDAFIVQDLGAAKIIKSISPLAPIHASTQMTIHSPSGASAAMKLGFKRAVLARELTKKQIEEISALDIETEIFVHGALCMSVSGQCYMSAMIGQRSANRGLCAQPCRLPFSSLGNNDFCALSLKDLSLADHVEEIKRLGVSSLKIEGRMKRPEYVAAAVSVFRNAIDNKPYDIDMLKAVFSRSGFTDGYFTGKYNDMFGRREKEDVVSAGKVFPEIHKLYRTERKVSGIKFKAGIKKDTPLLLTAKDDTGSLVSVEGSIPETALNRPVDITLLEKQLSKLGGTVYSYNSTDADIDEGLSVSAGELNDLRRKAIAALDSERIRKNTPTYNINISGDLPEIKGSKDRRLTEIRTRISDISQLDSVLSADRIIMPIDIITPECKKFSQKIIAEPPAFITDESRVSKKLREIKELGITHLMCNNIAYIQMGRKLGFTLHGDFRLNISNSYSADVMYDMGLCDITMSIELKAAQAADIISPIPAGIISYGRLPLMMTRNCPVKNEAGCGSCSGLITDRTGRSFPVICHDRVYTEILNPQALWMSDKLCELKSISFMTLYFTHEKPSEIPDIINAYRHGGGKRTDITRGLYFRGVY